MSPLTIRGMTSRKDLKGSPNETQGWATDSFVEHCLASRGRRAVGSHVGACTTSEKLGNLHGHAMRLGLDEWVKDMIGCFFSML